MTRKARNRSRKGSKIERYAIGSLKGDRHHVHRTIRTAIHRGGRWLHHRNDVFGCIDLIAKVEPGTTQDQRTRWIQVTGGRDIGRKRQKLANIPWNPLHDSVEIWRYIDGSGKRIDERTGLPRQRMYFQVYRLDNGFEAQSHDRIPAPRRKP